MLPDSTGGSSGGGIVSGIGREDLKILDSDIRFIRLGDSGLSRKGSLLFGSAAYFGMLAVLLALFVAVYLYLKKHLRDLQNVTLVRNRKASKVVSPAFACRARSYGGSARRSSSYEGSASGRCGGT